MDILCIICNSQLKSSEDLEATKCGHIFHDKCLTEKIKSSPTCPQCNQSLTEECRFRLYLVPSTTSEDEHSIENTDTLKSLLEDALEELDQQKNVTESLELKLRKLTEENESLFRENETFVSTISAGDTPEASLVQCPISAPIMDPYDIMNISEAELLKKSLTSKSSPVSKSSSSPANSDVFACKICGRTCGSRIGLYSHENSCLKKNSTNSQSELVSVTSPVSKSSPAGNASPASKSAPASSDVFMCKICGRICGSRIGLYSHEKSCLKKNSTNTQTELVSTTLPANKSSPAGNSSPVSKSSAVRSDVFICKICGRICGSRIGLYSHEKSCIKKNSMNSQLELASNSLPTNKSSSYDSSPTNKSSSASSDVFICSNCGRVCGSRIGLYSHEQSCFKKNLMPSQVEVAPRAWSLEGERRQQSGPSSSDSGHFQCHICGRVCGSRIGLYSHEQSCSRKNSIGAQVMTSISVSQARPRQQQARSTGYFQCSRCGRVCGSQIGLFSHERSCFNK